MIENGIVYEIYNDTESYFGSTGLDVYERLKIHTDQFDQFIKGTSTKYMSSFDIIVTGDYNIQILEQYENITLKNLELRESFYIGNYECVNKKKSRLTEDEFTEYKKKYKAEYYIKNKERLTVINKKYRDEHKEEMKEYKKEYVKKNKEKEAVRKREWSSKKIECICGSKMSRSSKSTHEKTEKHIKYINSL